MTSNLQMAGIPNLKHIGSKNRWLPHCRAEIITLNHQTHQKGSVETQPGRAFLVNQHKLAVHVTDQQTNSAFGRLNVRERDNTTKIF